MFFGLRAKNGMFRCPRATPGMDSDESRCSLHSATGRSGLQGVLGKRPLWVLCDAMATKRDAWAASTQGCNGASLPPDAGLSTTPSVRLSVDIRQP